MTPPRFRRQLEWALSAGYRFVPADQIARTGGRPYELAITFDDGVASVAQNAAPILADLGIPWTMFVVSEWADGRHDFGDDVLLNWAGLQRLVDDGVSIGSHSASHPRFGALDADTIRRELVDSRATIEARLGIVPTTFAIPFGQSRDWTAVAAGEARAAGYDVVYAQSESRRGPDTVARTFITRFDDDRVFPAAIRGAFQAWEEWV